MTHSEFMKAAHRQAKRYHVGCTYAQALSQAMTMLYAHRKISPVQLGYEARSCVTLRSAA